MNFLPTFYNNSLEEVAQPQVWSLHFMSTFPDKTPLFRNFILSSIYERLRIATKLGLFKIIIISTRMSKK
jgi:hypothetical protein